MKTGIAVYLAINLGMKTGRHCRLFGYQPRYEDWHCRLFGRSVEYQPRYEDWHCRLFGYQPRYLPSISNVLGKRTTNYLGKGLKKKRSNVETDDDEQL